MRVEPVAVSVFDAFRDSLSLHVDQIQDWPHGLVAFAEKLIFVLKSCGNSYLRQPFGSPLVIAQNEPHPRLILIFDQFPALRHNVHDARWCAVFCPGLDEESVVSRSQHRGKLIKEFAPFLESVRFYLQSFLKLRQR